MFLLLDSESDSRVSLHMDIVIMPGLVCLEVVMLSLSHSPSTLEAEDTNLVLDLKSP